LKVFWDFFGTISTRILLVKRLLIDDLVDSMIAQTAEPLRCQIGAPFFSGTTEIHQARHWDKRWSLRRGRSFADSASIRESAIPIQMLISRKLTVEQSEFL
jgi:hypothetical protein